MEVVQIVKNESKVIRTGSFIDAPVKGLSYKTASQSGTTNSKSELEYVQGEEITFTLANLVLGKVKAQKLITPYTLGDSTMAIPSDKTTVIVMLLQSLDADESNINIVDVSKIKNVDLDYYIDVDDEPALIIYGFNFLIYGNKLDGLIDSTAPVSAEDAINNMNTYLYDYVKPEISKKFAAKWLEGRTLYVVQHLDYEENWEQNKLVFGKSDEDNNLKIYGTDEVKDARWYIEEDEGHGFLEILQIYDNYIDYTKYEINSVNEDTITMIKTGSDSRNYWIFYPSPEEVYFFQIRRKSK